MSLRLYKYTTPETAALILRHHSIRCSSPLEFNDPFDVQRYCVWEKHPRLTISHLIDEVEKLSVGTEPIDDLKPAWHNFIHSLRSLVPIHGFKRESIERSLTKLIEPQISDVAIAGIASYTKEWLTQKLSSLRILCLSDTWSSILMWSHYAKHRNRPGCTVLTVKHEIV